ncbi:50S ribosomal protein L24 [Marinicella sp. W31]|uniref:50S ribosomal protein L24 n=1 Tax=Marinicella sp. W31 TaxID=3023713 RepID=UPI0037575A08
MNRIKKGDEVIVIAGRSKGQKGTVLRVLSEDRLLVDNVNLVKKHVKPNPQIEEKGGIKTQEAPIHISNVMLFNAVTGKGDRVGFKVEDGKKVRFFKSNDQVVDA